MEVGLARTCGSQVSSRFGILAFANVLPTISESDDLYRPRLQFVSVKRLLRSTVPAFEIVSICTIAVRPTPAGTGAVNSTRPAWMRACIACSGGHLLPDRTTVRVNNWKWMVQMQRKGSVCSA